MAPLFCIWFVLLLTVDFTIGDGCNPCDLYTDPTSLLAGCAIRTDSALWAQMHQDCEERKTNALQLKRHFSNVVTFCASKAVKLNVDFTVCPPVKIDIGCSVCEELVGLAEGIKECADSLPPLIWASVILDCKGYEDSGEITRRNDLMANLETLCEAKRKPVSFSCPTAPEPPTPTTATQTTQMYSQPQTITKPQASQQPTTQPPVSQPPATNLPTFQPTSRQPDLSGPESMPVSLVSTSSQEVEPESTQVVSPSPAPAESGPAQPQASQPSFPQPPVSQSPSTNLPTFQSSFRQPDLSGPESMPVSLVSTSSQEVEQESTQVVSPPPAPPESGTAQPQASQQPFTQPPVSQSPSTNLPTFQSSFRQPDLSEPESMPVSLVSTSSQEVEQESTQVVSPPPAPAESGAEQPTPERPPCDPCDLSTSTCYQAMSDQIKSAILSDCLAVTGTDGYKDLFDNLAVLCAVKQEPAIKATSCEPVPNQPPTSGSPPTKEITPEQQPSTQSTQVVSSPDMLPPP